MRTGDSVYITFTTTRTEAGNLQYVWSCPLCKSSCREALTGHIRYTLLKLTCSACRCRLRTLGFTWTYTRESEEASGLTAEERLFRSVSVPGWQEANIDVRHYGYRIEHIPCEIASREALLFDIDPDSMENFDEPTEAEIQEALESIWVEEIIEDLGDMSPPPDPDVQEDLRRIGRLRTRGN